MKSLTKTLATLGMIGALALGNGCSRQPIIKFDGEIAGKKVKFEEKRNWGRVFNYEDSLEIEETNGTRYVIHGFGMKEPKVQTLVEITGNTSNLYNEGLSIHIQKVFSDYRSLILNNASNNIQPNLRLDTQVEALK